MEHRWGQRVAVQVGAQVTAEPFGTLSGRARDVSLSGIFLVMPLPPWSLWTRVAVQLDDPAPAGQGSRRPIFAFVVRRAQDGVALEWCKFAPRAIRHLLARAARFSHQSRRARPRPGAMRPGVHAATPTGR